MPPAAVNSSVGRRAKPPEPVEIGALHHAFLIHVGAQETGAVRFERMEHLFRGETGGFAPALHDDAAVLGIERDENALAADGVAQRREDAIDAAPVR